MFRIIHLSDIHYSKKSKNDIINYILPAFIEDLRAILNNDIINLLFISGDLIDQAGKDFDSINSALLEFESVFLLPIISELKIPRDCIFFVPGNHDIDRNLDEHYVEYGLANKLIDNYSLKTFLDTVTYTTPGIQRTLPFYRFEKRFKEKCKNKTQTLFYSTYKINCDQDKLGIICLNSSWRCYNSETDRGNLLIDESQLLNALQVINDCKVKIILTHHSLDFIKEFNIDLLYPIIENKIDMYLCGHNHKTKIWENMGIYGKVFFSLAPSYNTENIRNDSINNRLGYNIIERNERFIKISHRHYIYNRNEFVPDTVIGDSNGKSIFHIDKKIDGIKNNTVQQLCFEDFKIINSSKNDNLENSFEFIIANLQKYFYSHKRVFEKDFPMNIFTLQDDYYIVASLEGNSIFIYDFGKYSLNFDHFDIWVEIIFYYQTIHSLSLRRPGNNAIYNDKSWEQCFKYLNKLYEITTKFYSIVENSNTLILGKLSITKRQIDNAENLFYELTDFIQNLHHNIIVNVEMALSNFHKLFKEYPLSKYLDE